MLASPAGGASPDAENLIASYDKADVIRMLLHECAGEVTVNKPFPRRVYGRPPSSQVDARTLAHDMERCGFTADDARAYFKRKNARENRPAPERVVTGAPAPSSASSAAASSASLRSRLRKLEKRERERSYREERRKAEGRRQLASQKSEKEHIAETKARGCELARQMHRQARDKASAAQTVREREERQAMVDRFEQEIRKRCG